MTREPHQVRCSPRRLRSTNRLHPGLGELFKLVFASARPRREAGQSKVFLQQAKCHCSFFPVVSSQTTSKVSLVCASDSRRCSPTGACYSVCWGAPNQSLLPSGANYPMEKNMAFTLLLHCLHTSYNHLTCHILVRCLVLLLVWQGQCRKLTE